MEPGLAFALGWRSALVDAVDATVPLVGNYRADADGRRSLYLPHTLNDFDAFDRIIGFRGLARGIRCDPHLVLPIVYAPPNMFRDCSEAAISSVGSHITIVLFEAMTILHLRI